MKETMTPRERVLAVLNREMPDRVPMDYWGVPEVATRLMKELNCQNEIALCHKLHIDRIFVIGPSYAGPALPPGKDAFGLEWRTIRYANNAGEYEEVASSPLGQFNSIQEIEREYTWPSIDWWDFGVVQAQVEKYKDFAVRGQKWDAMSLYCYLRGMERAFMDLIDAPEIARYCLAKIFDFCHTWNQRILEQGQGQIKIIFISDDMGTQEGLLMSPRQLEEFIFPGMKRLIDQVHSAGAFVFHHNDGAILPLIPRLIELGIDILNPIQWRCKGMDREVIGRDFGDKLIFHGGVDNQHTLPFGSAKDVREEVLYNLRVLGQKGGYILGPCHNIQVITPTENILALYQTGYEAGWR
jgi:uroporphyrinogen decarboxylase